MYLRVSKNLQKVELIENVEMGKNKQKNVMHGVRTFHPMQIQPMHFQPLPFQPLTIST